MSQLLTDFEQDDVSCVVLLGRDDGCLSRLGDKVYTEKVDRFLLEWFEIEFTGV